tara:strand:+ start:255 stop:560 length:306 start_codon:yes stop_codon:yes gene_type:complete
MHQNPRFIAIFLQLFFPMQPYVAPLPTSHKLPMALLACIPIIPYRPLRYALAGNRLKGFKMKPVAAPIALAMRLKIHCFLALQLKQVDTSVVTEDLKVFRD